MSTDIFAYNEATAGTASDDITQVIAGIESSLNDLGGFVTAAKSNWEGDEMELYGQIQTQWDTAAATVREILASISTALTSTTEGVVTMRSQINSALQQA